jgi:hypothetical protein
MTVVPLLYRAAVRIELIFTLEKITNSQDDDLFLALNGMSVVPFAVPSGGANRIRFIKKSQTLRMTFLLS